MVFTILLYFSVQGNFSVKTVQHSISCEDNEAIRLIKILIYRKLETPFRLQNLGPISQYYDYINLYIFLMEVLYKKIYFCDTYYIILVIQCFNYAVICQCRIEKSHCLVCKCYHVTNYSGQVMSQNPDGPKIAKCDYVTDQCDHVTDQCNHVTDRLDHVVDQLDHVTDQCIHVTGQCDHVINCVDNYYASYFN